MIPLWLGGVVPVDFIAALKIFWFGNVNALFGGHLVTDALVELAIAFILIWGITFGAIISLRRGKWISILGTYVILNRLLCGKIEGNSIEKGMEIRYGSSHHTGSFAPV